MAVLAATGPSAPTRRRWVGCVDASRPAWLIYLHAAKEGDRSIAGIDRHLIGSNVDGGEAEGPDRVIWHVVVFVPGCRRRPETAKAPLTCGRGVWSG